MKKSNGHEYEKSDGFRTFETDVDTGTFSARQGENPDCQIKPAAWQAEPHVAKVAKHALPHIPPDLYALAQEIITDRTLTDEDKIETLLTLVGPTPEDEWTPKDEAESQRTQAAASLEELNRSQALYPEAFDPKINAAIRFYRNALCDTLRKNTYPEGFNRSRPPRFKKGQSPNNNPSIYIPSDRQDRAPFGRLLVDQQRLAQRTQRPDEILSTSNVLRHRVRELLRFYRYRPIEEIKNFFEEV